MSETFSHTQACEQEDFPEWHQGRPRFLVWLLMLEAPEVQARVEAYRARLQDYLRPQYVRQTHLTLRACGLPCSRRQHADDILMETLNRQARELAQAGVGSFELAVQGFGSFSTAPYLGVEGGTQQLSKLRGALAAVHQEIAAPHFRPHLTLGLYHRRAPMTELVRRIQDLPRHSLLVRIKEVVLASYESQELGGRLRLHHRVALS